MSEIIKCFDSCANTIMSCFLGYFYTQKYIGSQRVHAWLVELYKTVLLFLENETEDDLCENS